MIHNGAHYIIFTTNNLQYSTMKNELIMKNLWFILIILWSFWLLARVLMPFLSLYLSLSLSLTSSIKASLSETESHRYQKENIKGGPFLFVEKKLNYQATTLLRHAFNLLGTVVGCCSESQTLNRYKSLLWILFLDNDTAKRLRNIIN